MKSFLRVMGCVIVGFFVVSATVFAVSEQKTDVVARAGCSYITAPILIGDDNNPQEVLKVQSFLKDYEQFDVAPTGIYDVQTIRAVRLFQERYRADILNPWGLRESTGHVSVTTAHKINEIYCGTGPIFSEEEKALMQEIRKRYGLESDGMYATTTASSTPLAGVIGVNGRGERGIPVGVMNLFALPILIMLFILLPTQVYYMWGLAPHRRARLIPHSFK